MRGVMSPNYDWADFDEVDEDIEDAKFQFDRGEITYGQLCSLIGSQAARHHVDGCEEVFYDEDVPDSIRHLFDDPESIDEMYPEDTPHYGRAHNF
jgi:hypothetical protein